MNRAHLVRNRADAANSRGNVRRLGKIPPAQECFKEPRRLEDFELHIRDFVVFDLYVDRTFALNAREVINFDCFIIHGSRSPFGTLRRTH